MSKFLKYLILMICLFTYHFSLICHGETDINQIETPKDPYEKFNRTMFEFNDNIDKYCLKPIATFYKAIIPPPITKGIHNIFQNLHDVSTVLNDLLQANFHQATADTWRFIANTTAGIGGFFDVASKLGVYHHSTNFGVTLARWGYKNSNYLVLPFWGPTTVRDALGLPIDYMTTIYPYIPSISQRNIVGGNEIVNIRAQALHFEDVYETLAIDPYIFTRNAYLQNRAHLIERSKDLKRSHVIPEKPEEIQEPSDQEIFYLEE